MIAKFSNEDLTRWKREINPAPIIGSRVNLKRENTEYIAVCPFHPDKNPSFKVYRLEDDGVWGFKCFGCGANGNVFQFVQMYDKVSFKVAVTTVLKEAGVAGWEDGQEQVDTSTPTPREHKEHVTFTLSQYTPSMAAFEREPKAHRWLAARGIGLEVARKFCLGFVQSAEAVTPSNDWINDGWVLFPTLSADHQTITAVKYRSLVGKKAKRKGGGENSGILRAPNTSTTMYNIQDVTPNTEDVWVVEGEPDTLVLAQAGLTAVGFPSAAYKPTDEECEVLSTAKRRFLAGDTGAAGEKAIADLQKRLSGATFVIRWPNNRKDANEVLSRECGNDPVKFKILIEDLRQRATQVVDEPISQTGDEIKPQRIKWLWENKIPLGKITLFAGNPDNGKSLASTSVAAICTKGKLFPDCMSSQPSSDVLMLLGEDDLADTAVPRLIAADADMHRIHFLIAVRPVRSDDREVRLDMDIPAMEKQLESNPDIRLIIIDPISNYLGDVSMVAEQEVRSIMIPLKRLAEKHNVAVVVVMHLNKKADLDAISRVGGAMAFIGVARCSWLFARNVEETEEGETETAEKPKSRDTFSMLRIKNNLVSSNRAGLSYSVDVKRIPVEGEADIITPYVIWGQAIEGSADEALGTGRARPSEPDTQRGAGRPADALQAAIAWLEEALQNNEPQSSAILFKDAKAAAGISEMTLRRAYEAIPQHVKPFKQERFWYWQLKPMEETQASHETPRQSPLIDVDGK